MTLSFAAIACGTDRPVGTSPPVDSLIGCISEPAVSPATATLHPGDTLRLRISGGARCATTTQWRWRSSDTAIAVVDSLEGLTRARTQGTATIIAEAVVDRNVKGAAAIVVVP
jgi:uncharacterized protein YjdB